MGKDERIDSRGRESAVNSAVGGLLSWVAGKDSVKRGIPPRTAPWARFCPGCPERAARRTSARGCRMGYPTPPRRSCRAKQTGKSAG